MKIEIEMDLKQLQYAMEDLEDLMDREDIECGQHLFPEDLDYRARLIARKLPDLKWLYDCLHNSISKKYREINAKEHSDEV